MALRGVVRSSRWLVRIAGGICLTATAFALVSTPAEARHYRHYRHYSARHAAPAYSPAFASIVVDANTGRTLSAVNENEPRHPASITKVMTLYLLFEQLEKGRVTLDSPIVISEHAASQAPSKLGLQPGETISVENAIKAIVTRSANDIAVAVAEFVGGDEDRFADMMTRQAHALGMSRTIYRNASGLPNDEQITTARDLSVLGRAIQERFPHYFHYFSTHSFEYAGQTIGNHNHLLGRVEGVDGIKTGYTTASGFNLLTSVHRDGRSLVAVILGGPSAGWRDRAMEGLIDQHIAQASTGGHSAPMIADNSAPEAPRAAPIERKPATPPALAAQAPTQRPPSGLVAAAETRSAKTTEEGEGDEDGPDLASEPVRAAPPLAKPHVAASPEAAVEHEAIKGARAYAEKAQIDPAALGWVKGAPGIARIASEKGVAAVGKQAKNTERGEETRIAKSVEKSAEKTAEAHPAAGRGGWVIQIGATDDAEKASDLLNRAKSKNAALASAHPFTEKVQKGDSTLFRARFAGLDSNAAEQACKSLKRSGFSCFAARD
jgi:D-alanyl-D-alanine carboxypeptidase